MPTNTTKQDDAKNPGPQPGARLSALEDQVSALTTMISNLVKQMGGTPEVMSSLDQAERIWDHPEDRPDFIEYGSLEHARMLGLVPDKDSELGWRLEDVTIYGPNATGEYLKHILYSRVMELTAEPPVYQSTNPRAPHYRPSLWKPVIQGETAVRGIV